MHGSAKSKEDSTKVATVAQPKNGSSGPEAPTSPKALVGGVASETEAAVDTREASVEDQTAEPGVTESVQAKLAEVNERLESSYQELEQLKQEAPKASIWGCCASPTTRGEK